MGWDGAIKKVPAIAAHCALSEVATVDTDSLDETFRLTNLWKEPEKVNKISEKMHSVSVGDILLTEDGQYHLVAGFGFDEVEV